MNENDFRFACTMLDNRQRLIAAGKLQRWDVVKWTVTVNVALAAASIGFTKNSTIAGKEFFWLTVIVACLGAALALYYNLRLTKTRDKSLVTEKYLTAHDIDYRGICGEPPTKAGWLYDWHELIAFGAILFMSLVPTYAVWCWG